MPTKFTDIDATDADGLPPFALGIADTAAHLGLASRTGVYRLLATGDLLGVHVGGRHVVTWESLCAFKARLLAAAAVGTAGRDLGRRAA